jgi:hypothetical protein
MLVTLIQSKWTFLTTCITTAGHVWCGMTDLAVTVTVQSQISHWHFLHIGGIKWLKISTLTRFQCDPFVQCFVRNGWKFTFHKHSSQLLEQCIANCTIIRAACFQKNIIVIDSNALICTLIFSKWPLCGPDIQQHLQASTYYEA